VTSTYTALSGEVARVLIDRQQRLDARQRGKMWKYVTAVSFGCHVNDRIGIAKVLFERLEIERTFGVMKSNIISYPHEGLSSEGFRQFLLKVFDGLWRAHRV
jgi:hypothetical protein